MAVYKKYHHLRMLSEEAAFVRLHNNKSAKYLRVSPSVWETVREERPSASYLTYSDDRKSDMFCSSVVVLDPSITTWEFCNALPS